MPPQGETMLQLRYVKLETADYICGYSTNAFDVDNQKNVAMSVQGSSVKFEREGYPTVLVPLARVLRMHPAESPAPVVEAHVSVNHKRRGRRKAPDASAG